MTKMQGVALYSYCEDCMITASEKEQQLTNMQYVEVKY